MKFVNSANYTALRKSPLFNSKFSSHFLSRVFHCNHTMPNPRKKLELRQERDRRLLAQSANRERLHNRESSGSQIRSTKAPLSNMPSGSSHKSISAGKSPVKRSSESVSLKSAKMDSKRTKEILSRKRRLSINKTTPLTQQGVKKVKFSDETLSQQKSELKNGSKFEREYNSPLPLKISTDRQRTHSDSGQGRKVASVPSPCKKPNEDENLYEKVMNKDVWASKLPKANSVEQDVLEVEHDSDGSEDNRVLASKKSVKQKNNQIEKRYEDASINYQMDSDRVPESQPTLAVPNDVEDRQEEEEENEDDYLNSVPPIPQKDADDTFELEIDTVKDAEEGNVAWENSSDFDGEDDELLRSMKLQEERHSNAEINSRSSAGCISILNLVAEKDGELKRKPRNMREKWEMEYLSKVPGFFSSSFAKMQIDQNIVRTSTGQHKAS